MQKKPLAISILIPAHNEEKMIASCVFSCLNQTRPPDQIVVVNDGSTDETARILETFGNAITVVTNPNATGNKSKAQERGIEYVKGDIVIATDGDTVLDTHFVEEVEKSFQNDSSLDVMTGYVQSVKHNTLTALREIDYTIGQDFFKKAQSYVHYLLVIPGCAGAFRTSLFRDGSISFDHDTLTEDLDFTYKLNTLEKIISFNQHAIVYTQDPPNTHSYINQMRRWYGGGWQNLKKHFSVIVSRPGAALILTATYLEGTLFNVALFALLLIDFFLFIKVMSMYVVIGILMGIYASIRKHRLELLFVSPLIPLMTILNAYILLEQFVKEVLLGKKNMTWFQPERILFTKKLENIT